MLTSIRAQIARLPRWLVHSFWLALCARWAVVDYLHGHNLWFGFWCALASFELCGWIHQTEVKFWRGMSENWRALFRRELATSQQQHEALKAALPLMETAARIVSESEVPRIVIGAAAAVSKEKAN